MSTSTVVCTYPGDYLRCFIHCIELVLLCSAWIANLDSIHIFLSSSAGHTISLVVYYSSKPKWNRLYVDICFNTNFQAIFTYVYSFERVSVKIVVEQFYLHMLSLTFVCKIVEGLFVHFFVCFVHIVHRR